MYRRPAALEVKPPYPTKEDAIVLPKAGQDTVIVLRCPADKSQCPFLDASTNDILSFLWEVGCSDNPSPTARSTCYRFVDEHTLDVRGALFGCGFCTEYE